MKEHEEDGATPLQPSGEETPTHARETRKLFVMRSGARAFAVYADEVEATADDLTPTPLPCAPPAVVGVVSLRGRVYTLIDPLRLFPDADANAQAAAPPPTQTPARPVVALKGDEQLALAVEHVERAADFFDHDARAADAASDDLVRRVIPHETTGIELLDPVRLFDAAMRGTDRRRRRQ
ncbi:MAG TPA: chemotaxis protein CheW [Pyrinomonadaceae bacterium]|nr:chemotaxis protein CheW [Pyrinomonadaceae bacterium]